MILERLLNGKLCIGREFGNLSLFEVALPLRLYSVCKTNTRQGGIEPAIMATENSAKVQIPKSTTVPILYHWFRITTEKVDRALT